MEVCPRTDFLRSLNSLHADHAGRALSTVNIRWLMQKVSPRQNKKSMVAVISNIKHLKNVDEDLVGVDQPWGFKRLHSPLLPEVAMRSLSFGTRDLFHLCTLHCCIAEFVGTFLFVFLGCGSVISSGIVDEKLSAARLLVIAIAHGFAIAILVAATCGVSGGHLNPAVTFGFVISGNMSVVKGLFYCLAQLAGASLGAGFYRGLPSAVAGHFGAHGVDPRFTVAEALGMEVFLTFVLVYVIFGTAVDKRGPSTIAPLAIGMAVLVDHLVGVPITGASMNPARTLGAAVWSGRWENNWVYWLGPLLGGGGAALLYTLAFLPSLSTAQKGVESFPEKKSNAVPV